VVTVCPVISGRNFMNQRKLPLKTANGLIHASWRRSTAKRGMRLDCHQSSLVAFCCKRRAWYPSCTNRRAVETGVRLVALLPRVRHRQWTFP
jgi:hypothetical protein